MLRARDPARTSLPLAHKKLGQALAALGRGREADAAFEEFFEQAPARGQVAIAMDHLRAGRRSEAIDTLRSALRENPDNVDALRCLAGIYSRDEKRVSATPRRCCAGRPRWRRASQPHGCMLGALLNEAARHGEAIECFRTATSLEPDNAAAWGGLGSAYAHAGDVQRSASTPTRARSRSTRAFQASRWATAMCSRRRAIRPARSRPIVRPYALKPDYGEVYWSMANLKIFRFEDAEVAAMEEQVAARRSERKRRHPLPLRARQGVRGPGRLRHRVALLRHRQSASAQEGVLRSRRDARAATRISSRYSAASSSSEHAGAGYESARADLHRRPAALGLDADRADPRQSQPGRRHAGAADARQSRGLDRPVSARSRRISESRARPAGEGFSRLRSAVHRGNAAAIASTDRPFFTDKLPNNFSHVGLAHLILPNAKIINARRHPLDSCLGGYKQLFGKGQHFTYDMAELARVLPQVPRDHAALAPRAAGQSARRALRGDGRRSRGAGAADPRSLRPAVRGGLRAFPRDRARRSRPRAPSRCASRSTRARSAPGAATKSTSDLAGRARRHHRGAAGARRGNAGTGSVVGPDLEAVDGVAHVHREVHRQQSFVRGEVVHRNRGRRRAAGDDAYPTARRVRARNPGARCGSGRDPGSGAASDGSAAPRMARSSSPSPRPA